MKLSLKKKFTNQNVFKNTNIKYKKKQKMLLKLEETNRLEEEFIQEMPTSLKG